MTWGAIFAGLFVALGSGAAIGAALGLTGLVILHFLAGGATQMGMLAVFNAMNSFTLSAVPMFVLLGEVMIASGLSRAVYSSMAPAFYRVPGRLLHTNIAVCTLFGAVSGSSAAVAAAVGSAAYPELARRGYDRAAVAGSLAGGGTLGLLIPPSLSLIIYGAMQEVSIGRLFLGGILPGLMMSALFMGYILVQGLRRPELTPAEGEAPSLGQILRALTGIWPLVILIGAVLGTIYAGLATPTEAAGLGVVAAMLLGATVGDLTLRSFLVAVLRSVASFGAISFVFIGAVLLSQSVSLLGVPRQVVELIAAQELGRLEVLSLVVLLYLVLGCFFDGISLLLITLPVLYPLMVALGFHPVWIGVFVTIMIEIGMITPPVGVNLFVLAAIIRGDVAFGAIAKASIPYWCLLLLGTAIITAFPEVVLFLPDLVM